MTLSRNKKKYRRRANGISFQVWRLITMAGFFMVLYYIALAAAYRAGDISIAHTTNQFYQSGIGK